MCVGSNQRTDANLWVRPGFFNAGPGFSLPETQRSPKLKIGKHFDRWSLLVIAITIALFLAAPFTSGIFHDLLLEAGVFLVSVKLILMAYKSSLTAHALETKLDQVHIAVQQLAQRSADGGNLPK